MNGSIEMHALQPERGAPGRGPGMPGADGSRDAAAWTRRAPVYDLSMAQLDPQVPLEDHRQALAVVESWFRQAGLTETEAALLVERFNSAVDPYTRPASADDRLAEEARAYLRVRWGADFARNMALVETAIARLGGETLDHFLRESGLRHDPFVLRTLVDVAQRSGWAGS